MPPASHDVHELGSGFHALHITGLVEQPDTSVTISWRQPRPNIGAQCLTCTTIVALTFMLPCHHAICSPCVRQLLIGYNLTPGQHVVCPGCKSEHISTPSAQQSHWRTGTVETFDPPPFLGDTSAFSHSIKPPSAPPKRTTRSMLGIEPMRRSISNGSTSSGVIQVTAFPWTARAIDLELLFEPLVGDVSVHILQDRLLDGKTLTPCFIEVHEGAEIAQVAVDSLNGTICLGDVLCCQISSQQEMLENIFPSWQPGFGLNAQPCFLLHGQPFEGNFLSEGEILGMAQLLRLADPLVHRAPERPYLDIVTVINKLPWRQPYLYSPMFATSIMSLALGAVYASPDETRLLIELKGAMSMLFTTSKDLVPNYLDVAAKLAQSICNCPATQTGDTAGVYQMLDAYWPHNQHCPVRRSTEPYTRSPPLDTSNESLATIESGVMEPKSSVSRTPSSSSRPSLDSPSNMYSPPALHPERSWARRRPDSQDSYPAIAHELGVDEELVRAIAKRLLRDRQ